jgi:hypothetical protein
MNSSTPSLTAAELELQHDRAQYGAVLSTLSLDQLISVFRKDCRYRWQALGTVDNLSSALTLHVLTVEQQAWLDAHQLTVADILKAEFPAEWMDEVEAMFCTPWNDTIGATVFSFKQA